MSQFVETPPATAVVLADVDSMIRDVAGYIGGDLSVRGRDLALQFLDRAAVRLNMLGVYLYSMKEKDYTSSDWSDGDTSLTLPDDWGWPTDPFIVHNSDDEPIGAVEWIPWHEYRGLMAKADQKGITSFASLLNTVEGNALYLFPAIDATKIGRLRVSYFTRIIKPSQATSSSLLMTEEIKEALTTKAIYLLLQQMHKNAPNIWVPFQREDALISRQARASAARMQQAMHLQIRPDEAGVFNTLPYSPTGLRTVYLAL